MFKSLRHVVDSIGVRLLLPLSITVGVILGVHASLSFRLARDRFQQFVRADVDRYSDLFRRATHDGMLLNRLDEVQSIIERLADGPQVAAIRFYDKEGAIVLSANPEEIGHRTELGSETCRSCHGPDETKAEAVLERSTLTRLPEGTEALRQLTVIENEPDCAIAACHPHPSDQPILGVLDVEMSMAPFDDAIEDARTQLLWTTLLLVLITGIVSAVVIRRVVQRPILQLHEGTRRIARGDLNTRIDVRGGHELAQLAEGFNNMVRDLKDARRQVTEWSQTLENRVMEKTTELRRAQQQVMHMEKMASLGKLSASVAHELNNPLSGMLTYARLVRRELREQPLEANAREELERYVDLIDKECGRCGTIVSNLLVFARRSGSEMTPIDLNHVVERSLMLVRHHLHISGVELLSQPLAEDSEIVADADQLEQALVALFVNAVEAMDPTAGRSPQISVRLVGDVDEVRIDVEDNGAGIPPDVLPHIFEPFFSTKEGESGVGLGLAVVYGIVQRHGGRIDVDSEPGRGTTFRLHLARRPQVASGEEPRDPVVSVSQSDAHAAAQEA